MDIIFKDFNAYFDTSLGQIQVVRNISTVFTEGKVTGLIGESGSGKSVIGNSILRLLPSNARTTGQCMYGERNLFRIKMREMRRIRGREIALIPQNPSESLNPVIRIKKQLIEAMETHKIRKGAEATAYGKELLRNLGLGDGSRILKRYSFEMSGGMNQRIITALGLACDPKWLIADEPTKGLDALLRNQVFQVLKTAARKNGGSLIVITHDLYLAYELCDEIRVLYAGVIVEQGCCREVMENPLHPYTKELLNSLPSGGMNPVTSPIEGRKQGTGCIFYIRCTHACERCSQEEPQEYAGPNGVRVRCFLYA